MLPSLEPSPRNVSNMFQVEEIQNKISHLVAENSELRSTLQQNNTYMRQLSSTLAEWQEDVLRVQQVYQNNMERAEEMIVKLRKENAALKQGRYLVGKSYEGPGAPVQNNEACLESLEGYVFVDSSNQESEQRQNQDEQPPGYESCSEKVKREVNACAMSVEQGASVNHDGDLPTSQQAVEVERDHQNKLLLSQTQSQLDNLKMEYEELSKKSSKANEANGSKIDCLLKQLKDLTQANLKLKEYSCDLEGQVSSMGSRLALAEEMVLSKQVDITELQAEVVRLEKSLETVPILRAQLELFQTDFEAERDARQNLAGEKDAMEQEIRLLKRQMNAKAPESSYIAVVTRSPQEPVASAETPTYQCPKCNFKFQTNEALNNHLDICLNQHMYP